MNADERQKELEEQEWQEELSKDPEFAKWLNDLDQASELIS